MHRRNLLILPLMLLGMCLSPWLISTFVPGLPSSVEGSPEHFYILVQTPGEVGPRLQSYRENLQAAPHSSGQNCPTTVDGWVDNQGMVDRIELTPKGNDRFVLEVFKDDLGGQAETYEYMCMDGKAIPIFSSENVLGFGLPVYGLATLSLLWMAWAALAFISWWLFGRRK